MDTIMRIVLIAAVASAAVYYTLMVIAVISQFVLLYKEQLKKSD
jgi:hypothetical protein